MESIKAAMEKAKDGDLTAQVDIATRDELQDLGEQLNMMTTQIGQLIKDTQAAVDSVSETMCVRRWNPVRSNRPCQPNQSQLLLPKSPKGQSNKQAKLKTLQQMTVLAEEIEVAATKFKDVELISNHTRDLSSRSKSIMEDLVEKSEWKQTKLPRRVILTSPNSIGVLKKFGMSPT